MRRQVIVDCETSSLTPDYDGGTGVLWELCLLERDRPPSMWRVQLSPLELASASDESLEIGRYHERTARMLPVKDDWVYYLNEPDETPHWSDAAELAGVVAAALDGVTIIGANPGFDAGFLSAFLAHHGQLRQPWHYRLRDIGSMAWGYLSACQALGIEGRDAALGVPPMDASTDEFALALGLDLSRYERHSALGDCRLVSDMLSVIEGAR